MSFVTDQVLFFLGESITIDDHLPLGSNVQAFMNRIQDACTEFVLALYTKKYYERSNDPMPNAGIVQEIELITRRIGQDTRPSFLIGMLVEGNHRESVPIQLSRYLYNPCVDSLGTFNRKKCVLELLILLKDKFYRLPISREIDQFIERYYPQNIMIERQNMYQRMTQEVIPSYSISVGRGIGQQTISGGFITQNFS